MSDCALSGVRVVDISQGIAGPYATKLLADAGATVIKVEPPEGDYSRRLGPFPGGVPDPERSGMYLHLNTSKRSVTLLLAAALFIAGISAWGSLQQELLPDISLPIITVITPFPGAGATDVADSVTKPIERGIGGVPRLESMSSSSANSISLVVAQFSYGTDVKATTATIQSNLQQERLPVGVTPEVSALDINASPVIVAAQAGLRGVRCASSASGSSA